MPPTAIHATTALAAAALHKHPCWQHAQRRRRQTSPPGRGYHLLLSAHPVCPGVKHHRGDEHVGKDALNQLGGLGIGPHVLPLVVRRQVDVALLYLLQQRV